MTPTLTAKYTATGPVTDSRAYRFLAEVPEGLRLPLLRLIRQWHDNRTHDSAGAVVRDLQRRLLQALAHPLADEPRRNDLRTLLAALGEHRRAAVELVGAIARGAAS